MSGKRLSEKEKLNVVSYYNKGKSQREVADFFHIGVDYVRSIIKQYGVLRTSEENNKFKGNKKIIFSNLEVCSIIDFYSENSLKKTAQKFNVSVDTISRILKENNYKKSKNDRVKLIAKTRKENTREKYPINEQEIIDFYLNHSTDDTCHRFHIQFNQLNFILEKNNIIKRNIEESINLKRETFLNRYGVEAPLQSPEIWKKKEQTTMDRYGVSNIGSLPEIKEKREITCLKIYGDRIPSRTEKIKKKIEATNIEKFGAKSVLCLKETQNKRKQFNIINYGSESPFSCPEIFAKAKETMSKKYGASNALEIPEIRSKQSKSSKISKLEKRFEEFLINNKFTYLHHYMVEGTPYNHEFDFAIFNSQGNLDVLIDCDGKYYHGYENDENGKTINTYMDDYRSSLVPEGVKFLICLEGEEEKAFSELLSLINISYEEYLNNVFTWCREVEFPYPEYKKNILLNSFKSLCKADINKFSMKAKYGIKIIDHFHSSIWKANKNNCLSPYNAWQDDTLLMKSIKNRVIYKGCNLDRSKVLSGFSIAKIAPKVSVFNPYLSKYIVEKYLSQYNEIFDPCSGYSGRMLGVCALGKKYIGQDINPITVEESNQIIKHFNLNASIECKDLLQDDNREYECLFTCTPYSLKEQWNQEIEDKSCDEWIDEILSRYKCKRYIFVVDRTDKYSQHIVEELNNKSHLNNDSKEYIIMIDK